MGAEFFYKGLVIGFLITTPVGPVGVLCARRSLTQGRLVGFVSGLGASVADAVYGALAAFGLTFVSEFILHRMTVLRLLGGLFMVYMGLKTATARPHIVRETPREMLGLMGDFASVFLLAMSNPMLFISLTAIFAALGLTVQNGGYAAMGALVLGVFLGSALWWVILSLMIGFMRGGFGDRGLRLINLGSGTFIAGVGALVLLSLGWWKG